jgi:hypothetical protein
MINDEGFDRAVAPVLERTESSLLIVVVKREEMLQGRRGEIG